MNSCIFSIIVFFLNTYGISEELISKDQHHFSYAGIAEKAADFIMYDSSGAAIHLKDFEGKLIYIELWATWCGPCKREKPYFEQLKEKYSNNEQVIFISLSLDSDRKAWKENIKSMPTPGLHFVTDLAALKKYRVLEIPRTILINKDFTVNMMRAPLPSNPAANRMIQSLL